STTCGLSNISINIFFRADEEFVSDIDVEYDADVIDDEHGAVLVDDEHDVEVVGDNIEEDGDDDINVFAATDVFVNGTSSHFNISCFNNCMARSLN
ncbi:unnamed protein product, partial [Rotaria socialis]